MPRMSKNISSIDKEQTGVPLRTVSHFTRRLNRQGRKKVETGDERRERLHKYRAEASRRKKLINNETARRKLGDAARAKATAKRKAIQRKKDREKWKRRWADPEFRKHYNAKRREYEHARGRKYQADRKRKWAKENPDHVRQYRKEYYARNKSKLTEKIYEGRRRRDPTYGLTTALNQLTRGDISVDEFTKICEERAHRINEMSEPKVGGRGKSIPSPGHGQGESGGGAGETSDIGHANGTRPAQVRKRSE